MLRNVQDVQLKSKWKWHLNTRKKKKKINYQLKNSSKMLLQTIILTGKHMRDTFSRTRCESGM